MTYLQFKNSLHLLRSDRIAQNQKKRIVRKLISFSVTPVPPALRNRIFRLLLKQNDLPAEFFPIPAALLECGFFNSEQYRTLIKAFADGKIRVAGKEIPVVLQETILTKLPKNKKSAAIFCIYAEFFNQFRFPNPSSIALVSSLYSFDFLNYEPDSNPQFQKFLQCIRHRLQQPGCHRDAVHDIFPQLLPDLVRRWDFVAGDATIRAVIHCLPKKSPQPEFLMDAALKLAAQSNNEKSLTELWRKFPSKELALTIVEKRACSLHFLDEILKDLSRLPKNKKVVDKLIWKWLDTHSNEGGKLLLYLLHAGSVSPCIVKSLLHHFLWRVKDIDALLKKSRGNKRLRNFLRKRKEFLFFLRKKGAPIYDKTVQEHILRHFPPEVIVFLFKLLKHKQNYYKSGRVVSTFTPSPQQRTDGVDPQPSPDNPQTQNKLFTFFLALLTRNNRELIQKGEEVLSDPSLMQRVRDSFSLKERKELFDWVKRTNLWEIITQRESASADRLAEQKLLKELQARYKNKKAVMAALERIAPSSHRGNGTLLLVTGGSSLNDLKVKSSDVGCCYFNGGGEERALVTWIISYSHFFFYIFRRKQGKKRARRKYIGVVMLFSADRGKSLVIDSVDGKSKTLNNFPGWQEWLISCIMEQAKQGGFKRVIINCATLSDLAREFAGWASIKTASEKRPLSGLCPQKNPKPVSISKWCKQIPVELKAREPSSFLSIPVTPKEKNG